MPSINKMLRQNQRIARFLLVLLFLGSLYLDFLLISSISSVLNYENCHFSRLALFGDSVFGINRLHSINNNNGEDSISIESVTKMGISDDPSQFQIHGVSRTNPFQNFNISLPKSSLNTKLPTLSIIPYLDIQDIRFLPFDNAFEVSSKVYTDMMEVCEKSDFARFLITDIMSFRKWWEKQSIRMKDRFTIYLKRNQISFNIGLWSLPDISLLRYSDLIDVISTGTRWIYSHFHIVVTTGIVMGGYEYPQGILTVLEHAGIELLIIYHTSSNTILSPSSSNVFNIYYGHGGLDTDGQTFLKENSNFYDYASDKKARGSVDHVMVVHAYGDETRLMNNLVNVGCLAKKHEMDTLYVWYDELIRWMASQCSSDHPNKQHIVILMNILSNQCASMHKTFESLYNLQQYINSQSSSIFSFQTSISSLQEYSSLLSKHHGQFIPHVSSSISPLLSLPIRIHHEIAVYSNKPAMKYTIRHAADLLSYTRMIAALMTPRNTTSYEVAIGYPMEYARQYISFAQSRYYKGCIATTPNMDALFNNLTSSMSLLSQIHSNLRLSPDVNIAFSLDDPFFRIPETIFQKTIEMELTDELVLHVFNKQAIIRNSIISFQVSYSTLCLYDSQSNLLHFQVYTDFENNVWMFAEVTVDPLSFLTLYIRNCDSSPYLTRSMPVPHTASHIGNDEFGIVLLDTGLFNSVYIKNKEIPFHSEIGYYRGGVERRTRTGHRIFNSQESIRSKAAGAFSLFTQAIDTGLFSYYTNKQELEVSIEEGPLFTEVTQFYCKDIAVKTRIYHPHYEHSSMKHTLQQQILIDSINITQEISYLINTAIHNNHTLWIDDADFSTRVISTDNKPTLGYNFFPVHSFMQMKETNPGANLHSITLLSDRLHAAGYHQSDGSFEVLLRRSSQWADIADYPEPFTNVWEKQRKSQQKRDFNMFNSKPRKLHDMTSIRDPYHRFYYLINTNQDKELQNLRMEDEEAAFIDRMNFYIHFDELEASDHFTPFKLKEQIIDPLYLSSCIHSMQNQATFLPAYHFIQSNILPSFIRIVDISKPFANVNSLVIQLRNILKLDSEDETPVNESSNGIDLCSLFTDRKAIAMEEVDITGLFTDSQLASLPHDWKRPSLKGRTECRQVFIEPGDIRSFQVFFN